MASRAWRWWIEVGTEQIIILEFNDTTTYSGFVCRFHD